MKRLTNIIALLAIVALLCAFMPNHPFTAAETQSISVPTAGLFDKSDAFTIDFSKLSMKDYCFPLPVGKSQLVNNDAALEITTIQGDAVKAMFDGVVRLAKNNPPFGNVIVVRHANGLETVYGYNAQNLVAVGDEVKAGQTIAIVGGENGRVFCNFAIMVNGRRINPMTIITPNTHRLRKQTVQFKKVGNRVSVSVVETERQKREAPANVSADLNKNPFESVSVVKWDLTKMKEGSWSYPLLGAKVISPYGGKRHHAGVDLKTKPNDKVRAAFDGIVERSSPFSGYGNCIIIRHAYGLTTLYSHQSRNLVKVGQRVKAGDVIGLTGRTGRATTEHLHFEVKFQGKRYNPNILFDHNKRALQPVILSINKNGNVTSKRK